MHETKDILAQLMGVIVDRRAKRPPGSYTTSLLKAGVGAIGEKLREETGELVDAARWQPPDKQHVVNEAADLIYHLLVMLAHCDVSLADVEAELARRFGTSGLAEKAAREKQE